MFAIRVKSRRQCPQKVGRTPSSARDPLVAILRPLSDLPNEPSPISEHTALRPFHPKSATTQKSQSISASLSNKYLLDRSGILVLPNEPSPIFGHSRRSIPHGTNQIRQGTAERKKLGKNNRQDATGANKKLFVFLAVLASWREIILAAFNRSQLLSRCQLPLADGVPSGSGAVRCAQLPRSRKASQRECPAEPSPISTLPEHAKPQTPSKISAFSSASPRLRVKVQSRCPLRLLRPPVPAFQDVTLS